MNTKQALVSHCRMSRAYLLIQGGNKLDGSFFFHRGVLGLNQSLGELEVEYHDGRINLIFINQPTITQQCKSVYSNDGWIVG